MSEPVFHIYRQRADETDRQFTERVETGLRAAARPFDVQITDTYSPGRGRLTNVYIIEDPR